MAVKAWTLCDVANDVYLPDFSISGADLGLEDRGISISKRVLRGGMSDGVEVLRVANGACAFTVLPTRGMNIWKAWIGDWDIGWRSPVQGPIHPQFVPTGEPSGLGWLDGFDELLARCGLESNGAPEYDEMGRLRYGLHGRISNKPAHHVEVRVDPDAGEIAVTGVVDEARFLFTHLRLTTTISTRFGERSFQIRDEVENLSARNGEMQLLYHINLGAPLLEPGAQVIVPASAVVPKDNRAAEGVDTWNVYGEPEAGFAEQVYFFEALADAQQNTGALLKNASGTRGVSIHYNKQQLPHFIVWKNTGALEDGYVTGLEPSTNFPNARTFEAKHGRVVKLPPGGKATFDLRLEFHNDAASVAQAEEALRKLQGGEGPKIHHSPQQGWSPA